MRLKDGLVLREVAGQYVIVPTGKRVQEIPGVVYLNQVGYFLWSHIKKKEFTREDLVRLLNCTYPQIEKERLQKDVDTFLESLAKYHLIEDNEESGWAYASFPHNYIKK